jgi:hypothetical protein
MHQYSSWSLHKKKRSTQAGVYKRRSSIKSLECAKGAAILTWNVHKRSNNVQAGVCTRGAAFFKLYCVQEQQQYLS